MPEAPVDASWAAARRRRTSPARIAAAVGLHLLALVALTAAFDRIDLRVRGDRSTTLVEVALAPLPAPAPPRAARPVPVRPPTPGTARRRQQPAAATDAPIAATAAPVAAVAAAPSAPASAPRLVLDPEATRLAIRAVARDPSPSGLARSADAAPGANERLAQGLAAAQKGDCMKGEFAGGGGGLLSLPFLIAAEAMGKCSAK
jgi:hypothetical protein